MSIFKKIFSINNDDCAIGLCKFNNELTKFEDMRKNAKRRFKKEATLTQILKRTSQA